MTTHFDVEAIRDGVRRKYAEVARTAAGQFGYATGRQGAAQHGYDHAVLSAAPAGLLRSFCGVGNPFDLGEIAASETVLDVGCGGGFDLFVASRLVGPSGRTCGIDLTPEMVDQAHTHLAEAGAGHAEVRVAGVEAIPYDDAVFDIVISNGVLNLTPRKGVSFREIFRVLRPGGRLQFADIVLHGEADAAASSIDAWSQ
jgi:SAM-dependent methyltransferase